MRFPIVLCLALIGCSAPEAPVDEVAEVAVVKRLSAAEQAAIIKRIEAPIELPPGAASMDEYSRNYGMAEDGKVHGVYAQLGLRFGSDTTCDSRERNNLPPCTDKDREAYQQLAKEAYDSWVERFAAPGESRWIGSFDNYPYIVDGECIQIRVMYDLAEKRIVWVGCNGLV